MSKAKGERRQRTGIVVSDKMNKTRVIRVVRTTRHPVYKKVIRKFIKFKVHDEKNESKIGDKIRVVETRPLSKDKRWRLIKILESHKE
ncbi:MAG: 30S ribosomal protein S17 [Candidatus Omnitrophica bacterium]|nr:30S ribosomal protein S17 [Candidatus Omnitrophota bacterium]MBU1924852.1 30S ribosomal protein S17 [Candidatus Omnitrophota bacterium]MBU2063612.1 30S ribosomal protein S17 [Candidatus Omnitrophota bacterium]